MSKLISPTKTRQFILDYAKSTRHHQFSRVSAETLAVLNVIVADAARKIVNRAPSKGKTL